MIQAVVFDIDNTLYEYEPCHQAGSSAMSQAMCRYRLTEPEEFQRLLRQAKTDIKEKLENTAACHNRMLYAQRICELVGIREASAALEMYNVYWDAFLRQMKLYDGVNEVFSFLKARGIKIGFCTDLTANIQMRKIVKLGLDGIPDAVVTSEECGREKPDKSMFLSILKKLEAAPESSVMVGDDYGKDICGAKACGMGAVLIGAERCGCDCAADFSELLTILAGGI